MRLRQAKKIVRNVELYPLMRLAYGSGRVMKAYCICVRHYKLVNNVVPTFENIDSINNIRCIFQGTLSISKIPIFPPYNNVLDIMFDGTLFKHTGISIFPIELLTNSSIDNGEGVK